MTTKNKSFYISIYISNHFLFLFYRKSRQKTGVSVSTITTDELLSSNENPCSTTVPSLTLESNIIKSNCLPYLENEFAIFTRSISECNIGELIRQPEGVDQNEWIAINCLYLLD